LPLIVWVIPSWFRRDVGTGKPGLAESRFHTRSNVSN